MDNVLLPTLTLTLNTLYPVIITTSVMNQDLGRFGKVLKNTCYTLCWYQKGCHSVHYDVTSGQCRLNSGAGGQYGDKSYTGAISFSLDENHACAQKPCKALEMCVPTQRGKSNICLLPVKQTPTASVSSPVAAATGEPMTAGITTATINPTSPASTADSVATGAADVATAYKASTTDIPTNEATASGIYAKSTKTTDFATKSTTSIDVSTGINNTADTSPAPEACINTTVANIFATSPTESTTNTNATTKGGATTADASTTDSVSTTASSTTLSTTLDRDCSVTNQCPSPEYRCVGGMCVCNLGYSLQPTSGKCYNGCDIYSVTFTRQSTEYCIDTYDKKLENVGYENCLQNCLNYRKTCLSFELWNSGCYLLTSDHHSVNPSVWSNYTVCEQHVRDCAL